MKFDFKEYTAYDFCKAFPQFRKLVFRAIGAENIFNPDYIVRVSDRGLEMGHCADEWYFKDTEKGA